MKLKKSPLYFIALFMTIISCSPKKVTEDIIGGGNDDDPTVENFYVKATIDGVNFINEENNATAFEVITDSEGITTAVFAGKFSETVTVAIYLKGFNNIGTYNYSDYEGSSMVYVLTDPSTGLGEIWNTTSTIGSGVVSVTQYGGSTARGTFSFLAINPIDQTEVSITDGEFYILSN